jgi:hypothetical protein
VAIGLPLPPKDLGSRGNPSVPVQIRNGFSDRETAERIQAAAIDAGRQFGHGSVLSGMGERTAVSVVPAQGWMEKFRRPDRAEPNGVRSPELDKKTFGYQTGRRTLRRR